jgi:glycine/D-amino acid oxidase-like deaminating enzyme
MVGFMTWATDHGAEIWKNSEVTAIKRDARGVSAVETARGTVATRNVVNCAGPWSADIAKMVGINLPVEPVRRMLVPTEPFDQFPHSAPMIIDMSTGFHFRPEGLGFLMTVLVDNGGASPQTVSLTGDKLCTP